MPSLRTYSLSAALCLCAGLAYAAAPKRPSRTPSSNRPSARPAATVSRPGARKPFNCSPKPSKTQCLKPFYLDDCGGQWGATCESYVKDGLDEHHSTNPSPEITMFKPNRTDIPTGLRKGKTNEYTGPKDKSDLLGTFPKYGKTVVKAGKRKSSIKPMAKSAVRPKLNGTAANNLGIKRKAPLKLDRAIKRGGLRRMTSDNIFSRTGLTRPPQSGSPFYAAKAHRNPAWDDNGNTVKSCEEYAYEMTYDWTR